MIAFSPRPFHLTSISFLLCRTSKSGTLQSGMSDCHLDSEDGSFDHLLKTLLTQSGHDQRGGFDSHKINVAILTAIR